MKNWLVCACVFFLFLNIGGVVAGGLVNYSIYVDPVTGQGNLTLNMSNISGEIWAHDTAEQEVKNQMGAVAIAVLAFSFIYLSAQFKKDKELAIRIGALVVGVLLATNATLLAMVNMAQASPAVTLMVWVVRLTALGAFMWLLLRAIKLLAEDLPQAAEHNY